MTYKPPTDPELCAKVLEYKHHHPQTSIKTLALMFGLTRGGVWHILDKQKKRGKRFCPHEHAEMMREHRRTRLTPEEREALIARWDFSKDNLDLPGGRFAK